MGTLEYCLPDWPPARIINDAVLAHNLRAVRNGEEEFTQGYPWPRLYPVVMAHLRHDYTSYDQELVAGTDRETLRVSAAMGSDLTPSQGSGKGSASTAEPQESANFLLGVVTKSPSKFSKTVTFHPFDRCVTLKK